MAKSKSTTASTAADDASTTPSDRGCIPVVVTTDKRGVFFGWAAKDSDFAGDSIRLELARNCLYWARSVGGFLGLAVVGPDANCRIGATAPAVTLRGVVSVTECSPESTRKWGEAPCVS